MRSNSQYSLENRQKMSPLQKLLVIAKAFDTSCPISDFVPAGQVTDPQNLQLKLTVSGEVRQDGNTRDMMRSIAELIAAASSYFTMEEGDILLTGTPSGVGRIASGDQLEASIEQVGKLNVAVARRCPFTRHKPPVATGPGYSTGGPGGSAPAVDILDHTAEQFRQNVGNRSYVREKCKEASPGSSS